MSELPGDLKYTKSHEWLRVENDGTMVLGITDHAQSALGELVYVELPDPGTTLQGGEACAVVESVKAASDVYSPIAGEVVAANEALADSPDLVNQSPYEDGWLVRLQPQAGAGLDALLGPDDYAAQLEAEDA